MRIALLTTGLRPLALGFTAMPGTPVGIVRWDLPEAVGPKRWLHNSPLLADAQARLRGRRWASLSRLCAHSGLHYADLDKRQPAQLRDTLHDWRIDLVVTSGCALVPMQALQAIEFGGINLHPSLLPRYRGADPLLWQVAAGEPVIGVSVHRLAQGSDTGEVLESATVPRPRLASRAQLTDLAERENGLPILYRAIEGIASGRTNPVPQPGPSPTRYARTVSFDQLTRVFPRESLDADTVADMIAFVGRCPDGWRDLRRGVAS